MYISIINSLNILVSARELTHTSNQRQDDAVAAGQALLRPQMGVSSPPANRRCAETDPGAAPAVKTGILITSDISDKGKVGHYIVTSNGTVS